MHTNNITFDINAEQVTICGRTYNIPQCETWPHVFVLSKLYLKLYGRNINAAAGIPRFVIPETEQENNELSLFVSSNQEASFMSPTVNFALYREGESDPIAIYEEEIEKLSGTRVYPKKSFAPLTVGRYILLGSNVSSECDSKLVGAGGERFYCMFDVLPTGRAESHPVMRSAEVRRKADAVRAGRYTSGALHLRLVLGSNLNSKGELSASCYSDDWALMAKSDCYHPKGRNAGDTIGITLRSKCIWMPGDYFVVLSHNREPYALVIFHFEGEAVTNCEIRSLAATDTEYLLVKHVERDEQDRWQSVEKCRGVKSVRPQLIRACSKKSFNSLCRAKGFEMLQANCYASVNAPTSCNAEDLAQILPDFLGFGMEGVETVDCREHVESLREAIDDCEEKTLVLCEAGKLVSPDAADKVQLLEEAIADQSVVRSLIFIADAETLRQLRAQSRLIDEALADAPHFEQTWPSVAETVGLIYDDVKASYLSLTPEAENALAEQVIANYETVCQWGREQRLDFINRHLLARLRQRICEYVKNQDDLKDDQFSTILAEDIALAECVCKPVSVKNTSKEPGFEESMEELNRMVGLAELKERLANTFLQIRFNERRRALGLPADICGSHHMLFTGNPGTGKTTVAKLIGQIYRSMGLLSKGQVVCMDRTTLVGPYIGHTEEKMLEVLEKARGNVLFIDEAYALCDSTSDRKDFGNHVIEALLPILAEPNPNMLVIMAGYEDEMQRLMQMNQGLKGRFPHQFNFPDYTADELMRIGDDLLQRLGYVLSEDARQRLVEIVGQVLSCRDRYFCNARWIKQFVESGILPAMARRVMQADSDGVDRALLSTIERCDVESAAMQYALQNKPRNLALHRRIGFVA